jgi:hypothetical protein
VAAGNHVESSSREAFTGGGESMASGWEWRCFQLLHDHAYFQEAVDQLSRQMGPALLQDVMAEVDDYLVLPGVRHNLKFRRGKLELKRELELQADGFSYWSDKKAWQFPLSAKKSAAIWSLIPLKSGPPAEIASPGELLGLLRKDQPGSTILHVSKRRARFQVDSVRFEIADLVLFGDLRFRSFSAESPDLVAARLLIDRTKIARGMRQLSYAAFLQEAAWWFPERAYLR